MRGVVAGTAYGENGPPRRGPTNQRRRSTDGTTLQESEDSVNDFSLPLVHENTGDVQQNQSGVILPVEWKGPHPQDSITPAPVRSRVQAPDVLVPRAVSLSKYDVVVGWDTEYVERVDS